MDGWDATTAADTDTPPLTVCLFGPLEVRLHGAPLPHLRSRKGHWLLALLALRAGREVERSWLAGTLWPDSSESQTLSHLRKSLTDLRRALGPEAGRLRSPSPQTLALDLSGAAVDLLAFDACVADGEQSALEQAVSLYRGPLLEGCAEEWIFQERENREQAYLQALETLADHARSRGDSATAEQYLRRVVAVDPQREGAQRALMQVLASGGNTTAATQLYRELREQLHREQNAQPDPETTALYDQIRAEAQDRARRRDGETAKRRNGEEEAGSHLPSVLSPSRRLAVSPSRRAATTLTFLLTDIEGSTKLWLQDPEAMHQALARHDALLTAAIEGHGGTVLKQRGEGDSGFAVFSRATDAVAAAVALQRALGREPWPEEARLQVRVALHTGEAEGREGDYYGLAVNHCARLRAVGHGEQTLLSQTTAALAREVLPEEVSLRELGTHRLKDLQRAEPIFQVMHPELPGEFPPLRSLEAFAHNLPLQLTRFIGREREIAEVKELLQQARLLTLTGAGGCGKTRLGLQVAAELVEEFPDGVCLVELAALSDPSLVPQTVAIALGVRETPGRLLTQTLIDIVRPKQVLLLLDNCEHLLSACAQLTQTLLQACPRLRMLASSREALGLMGEQSYRVPPLSLPEANQLPPLERLQEFEALQLFTDRAVLGEATFALTTANAASVVQVCQQLDGMPLAIELAAARAKSLPVEQIAAHLDDRFRLLTGGSRTALPRQQTLRALIDWSYDLLTEAERALLRRTSVFAGGWTLAAAEAVCVREGVEAWEVLDWLTSLVEKSLALYEERGGEARYRLLETVRQYARDRLLEAEEAEAVRGRHRDWFLALAEEAFPVLWGREQVAWLDRLETEHDNFRVALEWSGKHEPEGELRLAGALWWFWHVRGYLGEGRARLEAALQAAERHVELRRSEARARALDGAGVLAQLQGDHSEARPLLEESLTIFREQGDKQDIAFCLTHLGFTVYEQGDYALAGSLLEESLAILREEGSQRVIADCLDYLGLVAYEQGDYAEARSLYEESLTVSRDGGNKWGVAARLGHLGRVAYVQGDYSAARSLHEESLTIWRELGYKRGIAQSLESFARPAARGREWERAARLLGAAAALREAIGAPPAPIRREEWERELGAARAALGEAAFAASWAEGRAMMLEQSIAYALAE